MRLLVVEDEKKIALAVQKGLERQGYKVDAVFDGQDGYDYALTGMYDAIVLDWMLPKKDGPTICSLLREKHIKTPILMLTAKSQVHEKVTGFQHGADDYLAKPFAFEELIARIKALLRRPQNYTEETLHIDDLEIHLEKHSVSREETPITLSATEFMLLEYLARNKNKVLSKDQIIENVWDYDSDVLPNTVEVYIGYLRNKVDKPFPEKKPLIQTVRGFGYKIEG